MAKERDIAQFKYSVRRNELVTKYYKRGQDSVPDIDGWEGKDLQELMDFNINSYVDGILDELVAEAVWVLGAGEWWKVQSSKRMSDERKFGRWWSGKALYVQQWLFDHLRVMGAEDRESWADIVAALHPSQHQAEPDPVRWTEMRRAWTKEHMETLCRKFWFYAGLPVEYRNEGNIKPFGYRTIKMLEFHYNELHRIESNFPSRTCVS